MLKHTSLTLEILLATVIGGIAGFAIPALALIKPIISLIPGIGSILAASPFPVVFTTTILGMVIGGLIGAFAPFLQYSGARKNTDDNIRIKLREEQLDISKSRVKMADVDVRKEIRTDEKTITVPVTQENLVVEKKAIGKNQESTKTRIPLSEERIEVIKHPEQLNEVSIQRKEYTETEVIGKTLKKEKLSVNSKGDAKIRNK